MDEELSSESSVTINRLSSTLSSFAVDYTLEDLLHTSFAKAMTYPMIRNFDVAMATFEDLKTLFDIGNVAILKIFLRLKILFEKSEPRYLLNRLYIEDYCIFVQMVSPSDWKALSTDMKKVKIEKGRILLNLNDLEAKAMDAMVNKDFENMEIDDEDS